MPKSESQPSSPFRGFRSPNYTPVPDELFDELLVELSGAELKALLYIVRRTFGFKRDSDNISLSQMLQGIQTRDGRVLDRGVGLSKKTLLLALRSLEDRGIILTERRQSAEKGNEPTAYCLNVIGSTPGGATLGEERIPPLGEKVRQGVGGESTPSPWGRKYPTQETVRQNTATQETVEQQTHIVSNSFDGFANLQHNGRDSKFSKKRISGAKVQVAEQPTRGQSTRRAGTGEMTAVDQVINRRRTPTPRYAPVTPETTPETAANGQLDVEHPTDPSRVPERPRRGRPPALSPYLEDLVDRYSHELHDEDHAAQNRGQAARLWKASGWSETAFSRALVEAKAITLTYDIQKRARVGGELGLRNKMPYFFTVVRDLLGQADADARGGGT